MFLALVIQAGQVHTESVTSDELVREAAVAEEITAALATPKK